MCEACLKQASILHQEAELLVVMLCIFKPGGLKNPELIFVTGKAIGVDGATNGRSGSSD